MDPSSSKVTDLKVELARRGLETNGLKAELLTRLLSAVEDESFVVTESKKEAAAAAGTSPGESVSGRAADADPALGAQASEQHDMEVGSALGDGDTPLDNSGDSDSEEEEDDAVIVITGDINAIAQPTRKRVYERGSNTYVRPDAFKDDKEDGEIVEALGHGDTDLNKLRFSYRLTAFDTDFDEGADQPWRKPRTDISDFFNYGFTEATWKIYCAKQLRYRVEQGMGPSENNNAVHST